MGRPGVDLGDDPQHLGRDLPGTSGGRACIRTVRTRLFRYDELNFLSVVTNRLAWGDTSMTFSGSIFARMAKLWDPLL